MPPAAQLPGHARGGESGAGEAEQKQAGKRRKVQATCYVTNLRRRMRCSGSCWNWYATTE